MPFFVSSRLPGRRTLVEMRCLQGWADGWDEVAPPDATPGALARWRAEAVFQVLEKRRIHVTDSDCLRIARCTDPDVQARWIRTAILCDSVDDLFRERSDG
ncbi:hypothetical protein [Streptomyces sp. NBC_01235]|uniref:hypothetical protein n=1 Tax=Streptomyces sp. NBC_01235 TaxID=2903788 RepID=UPI002E10AC2B|nr:hypothetical protein OG289_26345 [Streptomyces sp. NBC_01235]